jgi:glutamate N-acetyltransferase/amino-acid N-acetyltransferase
MRAVKGGVTAPAGYRASAAAAGIKPGSQRLDCALIVSEAPASLAGMFTSNRLKSPPTQRNEQLCARGRAGAIFTNSGNANACTGEDGRRDAQATADHLATLLSLAGDDVCTLSTGVIGVPLPMDRLLKGAEACVKALETGKSLDAARAIMTTDTVPKEAAYEVSLPGGTIRIGAIAKGSGMIAPNMATMIGLFTTDAAIDAPTLRQALRPAVERSFNCICVDNDMSTSDTVLCLANGRAEGPAIEAGSQDFEAFARALEAVCVEMAQRLVRDGEGATKFIAIEVDGAASDDEAKRVARAVAQSQLCKTAFFGEDPNWGRIACAAGYSGADFDPTRLRLWLGSLQVVDGGRATAYREAEAAAIMQEKDITVRLSLGDGPGAAVFWTSDLSHDYVSINADYRT